MLFQRKRKYATIPSPTVKRDIPEGLMNKCGKCGTIQFTKELEKNFKVCSSCGHHFMLTAWERIAMLMDDGRLFEFDRDLTSEDPLGFPDYADKLDAATRKTGLREAIVTGEGTIGGFPVVIGVMSFDFIAATLGGAVGEKIVRAVEIAIQKKYPLILFTASGGARMQEGLFALMQMAKTSAAIAKLHEKGGLYISVLTDPTYGGVSASFAMLGDIILAEPGANIGFSGKRVIEQTIREKLPDDFQTAEFNLQHGQIDLVVHRKDLRNVLIKLLDMHAVQGGAAHAR